MSHHLPSYLRTFRKRWALTQDELGNLLGGMAGSAVSKFERLTRQPPLKAVIAAQIIFQQDARDLFPALYAKVERNLSYRAQQLLDRLEGHDDGRAEIKRELLMSILARCESDTSEV